MKNRVYFVVFCIILLSFIWIIKSIEVGDEIDKIKWVLKLCDLVKVS